jgi:hypothetical protein
MSPPQRSLSSAFNGLSWGLRTLARAAAQIAAELSDGARLRDRLRLQTLRVDVSRGRHRAPRLLGHELEPVPW